MLSPTGSTYRRLSVVSVTLAFHFSFPSLSTVCDVDAEARSRDRGEVGFVFVSEIIGGGFSEVINNVFISCISHTVSVVEYLEFDF